MVDIDISGTYYIALRDPKIYAGRSPVSLEERGRETVKRGKRSIVQKIDLIYGTLDLR